MVGDIWFHQQENDKTHASFVVPDRKQTANYLLSKNFIYALASNKLLFVVWNIVALGLLVNIVTHAILSLPTPFQQSGFEQPNRAVLYFPFIWLPAAVTVPEVFVAHLLSLWQLAKMNLTDAKRESNSGLG